MGAPQLVPAEVPEIDALVRRRGAVARDDLDAPGGDDGVDDVLLLHLLLDAHVEVLREVPQLGLGPGDQVLAPEPGPPALHRRTPRGVAAAVIGGELEATHRAEVTHLEPYLDADPVVQVPAWQAEADLIFNKSCQAHGALGAALHVARSHGDSRPFPQEPARRRRVTTVVVEELVVDEQAVNHQTQVCPHGLGSRTAKSAPTSGRPLRALASRSFEPT
mmetsp:Transcript_53872/g.151402  ORF Transcript_53872/g.151402 Transcript_53872/m.151402 type:complete len:219 (+) Transcript_53872:565-1221(+)